MNAHTRRMIIFAVGIVIVIGLFIYVIASHKNTDSQPSLDQVSQMEDEAELNSSITHVYKLTEYLSDDVFNDYMEGDSNVFDKLKAFRDKMVNSPEFNYYSYAENLVEMLFSDVPDECILNHGTEFEAESRYEIEGENVTCVNAIQVSKNYFSLFPITVYEGREFIDEDYKCQNSEYIPVILGSDYQDVFNLGDTFEGYYILERRKFKVVGFVRDCEFYSTPSNSMVSLDHYIIMPFMDIETDSFAARAILLQQASGLIEYHGSREDALDIVKKYLVEAGLKDWRDDFGFLVNEVPTKK